MIPQVLPGDSCPTAGTMELGVWYSGFVPPFGRNWWRFPSVAGVTYRLETIQPRTEFDPVLVPQRPPCPGGFLVEGGPAAGRWCLEIPALDTGYTLIQVFPITTPTYMFRVVVGSCPP